MFGVYSGSGRREWLVLAFRAFQTIGFTQPESLQQNYGAGGLPAIPNNREIGTGLPDFEGMTDQVRVC